MSNGVLVFELESPQMVCSPVVVDGFVDFGMRLKVMVFAAHFYPYEGTEQCCVRRAKTDVSVIWFWVFF